MNRLSRDEIIHAGLDQADIPTLDAGDRPDGVLLPRAKSIMWLQMASDYFHKLFPFQTDINTARMLAPAMTDTLLLASDTTKFLPDDFNLTVKDGLTLIIESIVGRLRERSLQSFININLQFQHHHGMHPICYNYRNDSIKVAPICEDAYTLDMMYYAQAPVLRAEDKLKGMDEWCAVEYIRLRALEWIRILPPDSAKIYLQKELSLLKSNGLLGQTEYERLPLYSAVYLDSLIGVNPSPWSWMGPFS